MRALPKKEARVATLKELEARRLQIQREIALVEAEIRLLAGQARLAEATRLKGEWEALLGIHAEEIVNARGDRKLALVRAIQAGAEAIRASQWLELEEAIEAYLELAVN